MVNRQRLIYGGYDGFFDKTWLILFLAIKGIYAVLNGWRRYYEGICPSEQLIPLDVTVTFRIVTPDLAAKVLEVLEVSATDTSEAQYPNLLHDFLLMI
jgi:hypothetical protein